MIYSAAESDIVWYMRFSEEYSENDVYDIIGGINISSADALAAWDGKLKYYDSKLLLTVYEQYERAQDRIDFLGKWVSDENGAPVRVFALLAEELKTGGSGFYEKLKNPVSSAQTLLGIDYVSYMIYNYNRLWKLLIDKGMTKTQMRKAAGISTNILAKMGKGEPVAMDSLAKICVALSCSVDDIVEINGGAEKGGE